MKRKKSIMVCFYILLSVFFLFPAAGFAEEGINLPVNSTPSVTASAGEKPLSLAPYIRYAYNLDAKDAKSALAQKKNFLPYDVLTLKKELGTYWFLISFDKMKDKDVPAAYLDLGNFLPKNSHVLVYSKSSNRWQVLEDVYTSERKSNEENFNVEKENSASIFHSGLYDLTSLREGGELLIYSPGVPSIWFAPKLISPAQAPLTLEKRLTPIILLGIFVLMIFIFWRGAKEEGDARIWAAFLCLAVLVQYVWGVPQNVSGKIEYLDMVGIVASCMAVFFLPHIGRHLLVTEKKSPNFDSLLQFLAIPAIFPLIVIFVPIPEYLYIIRFAPLWPLYALVLFVLTIPFVLSGKKGARLYAFFCLSIGLGCLAALALRHNPEWYFLNYLGVLVAMVGIFLAPRQTERNVFSESMNHDDIVSAFAENNTIMRDALYRVELKLRDPFDRIMREACFLDFNLKNDELSESIKLLQEKELGDMFERRSLTAVDDLQNRAERLQEHTSSLVLACRDLSGMLGHITELTQKENVHQQVFDLFNVKTLVTQACDNIRAEAQDRQVGLGWYIAPNIGLHYRGDKNNLENVLALLLRDAVRATEKGMISVRVRRANSPNPGHLVFTISDSGKGKPPLQRSILTLVKAWELAAAYNGEVELRSSPNGLSFSFSMQCLAMNQTGEKPLSYASLDDIVLAHNEVSYAKPTAGVSGGNIVFEKESVKEEKPKTSEIQPADSKKHIGILIISPLAIQRQNFAYYLNRYETWEALDVESALAFYEKKPASIVLVHSALSSNGCSAVIAGIRLLEDSLGIAHAPCVGLYQSAKDRDFLLLAGCQHTLPDNIGREDLCTAVDEILGNKDIQPITDIDAPHSVVKHADVRKAVEKRLHAERVFVGSVVDGAVADIPVQAPKTEEPQIEVPKVKEVFDTAPLAFNSSAQDNEGQAERTEPEKRQEQVLAFDRHQEKKYENTLDFHEDKGFFRKFLGKLRPAPNKAAQAQVNLPDEEVGEPQPLSVSAANGMNRQDTFADHAEFLKQPVQDSEHNNTAEITEYAEQEQEKVSADSVAQTEAETEAPLSFWQEQEQEKVPADGVAQTEAETEAPLSFWQEQEQEKVPADGAAQTEAETEAPLSFWQEQEQEKVPADGVAQTEAETEAPLSFWQEQEQEKVPADSVVQTEAETEAPLSFWQEQEKGLADSVVYEEQPQNSHEDKLPFGLVKAVEEIDQTEEITEKSVFVQSGLISMDGGSERNSDTLKLKEEEKTAETAEAEIFELSSDMLVRNFKKDEQISMRPLPSSGQGLDIMLDYRSASREESETEDENRNSDKSGIDHLSFFPTDNDNRK